MGALPKASFTVAPVSGAVNLFAATASTSGVFSWFWDPGDGSQRTQGTANDTLYYAKAGNYRVTLLVLGQGGYDTVSQIVQVAANDPGINILQDTTFTSNTAWTKLNTGAPVTTTTLNAPGLNLSNPPNSGFTNSGVYQPVAVIAGKPYTFHANVQGAGATNTWVEVYIGWTQPTQGKDYTDTKLWSLNTWSGCGKSAFSGNIDSLSCSGSGPKSGQITFAQSGTVYLVIKAGSAGGSLGTGGVTFTNIGLNKPSR
ncbi:hypothetical protein GCM10011511_45190 [Puia dinghuensis]|uniref:PKD domain-containing protein n=1 Tax=Puia dinghuensis TaxID=1792502 RepID=A0A8J2UGZ6_9BACT|nr:hypothetical protein GCM10011511_45190 [Puia dinghuensis]